MRKLSPEEIAFGLIEGKTYTLHCKKAAYTCQFVKYAPDPEEIIACMENPEDWWGVCHINKTEECDIFMGNGWYVTTED
jgi:hypothetical protein